MNNGLYIQPFRGRPLSQSVPSCRFARWGVSLTAVSDQRLCLWTPRAFEKARSKLLFRLRRFCLSCWHCCPKYQPTFEKVGSKLLFWREMCFLNELRHEKSKVLHCLRDSVMPEIRCHIICIRNQLFSVPHCSRCAAAFKHRQIVQTVTNRISILSP